MIFSWVSIDLINMPGRCNLGVVSPQFNGQFGIAFQADPPAILRQVEQGKHLPGHLEDQSGVIDRESFGDTRLGDAILADPFDVQDNTFFTYSPGFDP